MNFKVRRKTPLANFISSIKSIKSVVVTSDSEMTVAGNNIFFILPDPLQNEKFTLKTLTENPLFCYSICV